MDRTHEIGKIAGELLHDVSADLDTLSGWALVIAEGAARGHVNPSDAQRLFDDTQRIGRLVSDAVTWIARPDHRDPVQPAVRLADLIRWIRNGEGVVPIHLEIVVPDAAVEMPGPGSFFDRAASNLIRNAVRHARTRVNVSLHARPEGGRPGIVLRVEDDGPGVPPGLHERLFTPLARAEATGHGLGLSATAWLVSALGGTPPRAGDSQLGGACFELWFPVHPPQGSARRLTLSRAEAAAPFTVAILDDEPSVRRIVARFVEMAGAKPLLLDPTDETVAALRLGAIHPDALLLDRNLGFTDGYDLWLDLRTAQPELARRTALLTGGLSPADAPPDLVVLHKPVDRGAIARWIAAFTPTNAVSID